MADWAIEPLADHHDRADFDRGKPPRDDWIRRYAGQYQRRDLARAYVLDVALSVFVLDARPAFRSATSLSFRVEWNSHDHEGKFRKGGIEVPYPCEDGREGRIKAVVRISLSEPYAAWESKKAVLETVFRVWGVPEGTPFPVHF